MLWLWELVLYYSVYYKVKNFYVCDGEPLSFLNVVLAELLIILFLAVIASPQKYCLYGNSKAL